MQRDLTTGNGIYVPNIPLRDVKNQLFFSAPNNIFCQRRPHPRGVQGHTPVLPSLKLILFAAVCFDNAKFAMACGSLHVS